jgi:hypothetical protein
MKTAGRLFFRGFLLQALFNPVGQQRGGLAWIAGRGRNLSLEEPFNVNPTLAGYAIGLACSSEEGEFSRRRASLTAALSGLGDRLVWGLLRSLAVVIGLAASAAGAIPSAVALLLVYNLPELCLRWRSTVRGLHGMHAIAGDLAAGGLPRLTRFLSRGGILCLGCLAGLWLAGPIRSGRAMDVLAGCAGVVAAVLLLKRSGERSGIVAAAGSLLLGLLWLAVLGARSR